MTELDLEGLEPGDSEDFTDKEADTAIETSNSQHFVQVLEETLRPMVRPNVGGSIQAHELRRRAGQLYCRTRINLPDGPDKVLIFRVNWLGG